MHPLSDAAKVITDSGSVIVAVVAKIDALEQSNDAALRSWAKDFAVAVARYRGVNRILSKWRDKPSFLEPAEVKDALVAADDFLLKHTHWTWDEAWLDSRWKRAALERKKIWEAEEERLRKLREEEEISTILAEAQAFLKTEVVVFDYPTEEEWEALRNQPPLQEDPAPISFFNPTLDMPSESPDSSFGNSPLSFSDMSMSSPSSPPSTAPTPLQSPKIPVGNIDRIWDDPVLPAPQIGPSSNRADPGTQLSRELHGEPTARKIAPVSSGSGTTGKHVGPAKSMDSASASEGHVSTSYDSTSGQASINADVVIRPRTTRATLPTTKGAKTRLNSTANNSPNSKINTQPPKTNVIASTSPKRPQFSQLTVTTSSQFDGVRVPSPMSPAWRNKRARDDDDDADEDEDEFVRRNGGTLIGTGQINSPSCSSCSKVNSKCFRLNNKSCCARCYQEHQKCPLDKPKTKKQKAGNIVG
ncbi:hypothetical protein F5879DRAFT_919426 [Lentinula edodes]|uniref:uncharacterized protein n=1 Tax=Lentinula edodes TaxID=5353 RepID=UPI001E8D5304|nr:uncharacterized protein C8R40DRAFT_1136634 [Lentinula edodes]KAH7868018.1 hypothetical protein C8R40DRAFT_1136634 [Lentinula edodes]KAJ3908024.1 hypothetical protein F5879DRAFT_919426 [Lentinula edodes]